MAQWSDHYTASYHGCRFHAGRAVGGAAAAGADCRFSSRSFQYFWAGEGEEGQNDNWVPNFLGNQTPGGGAGNEWEFPAGGNAGGPFPFHNQDDGNGWEFPGFGNGWQFPVGAAPNPVGNDGNQPPFFPPPPFIVEIGDPDDGDRLGHQGFVPPHVAEGDPLGQPGFFPPHVADGDPLGHLGFVPPHVHGGGGNGGNPADGGALEVENPVPPQTAEPNRGYTVTTVGNYFYVVQMMILAAVVLSPSHLSCKYRLVPLALSTIATVYYLTGLVWCLIETKPYKKWRKMDWVYLVGAIVCHLAFYCIIVWAIRKLLDCDHKDKNKKVLIDFLGYGEGYTE